MKDVYHSLQLLRGKTAVSKVVAKFMTNYVQRTTHSEQESKLHHHTVKDIRQLATGDALAI